MLSLSNCEPEDGSMEDLVRKIQSMTLTRTDAEIAEYILAHLSTIGSVSYTHLKLKSGHSYFVVVTPTKNLLYIRSLYGILVHREER